MSETDEPQPGPEQPGPQQQSGAEAPPPRPEQPQQAEPAPPAQPVAPPPPAPVARRPARTVKTWVAAVAGAVLLVGGGVGGYFIGAANDHDRDRPGFGREHRPDFRDFPWRGDEPPAQR